MPQKPKKAIDFKYNLKIYWQLLRKHKPTAAFLLVSALIVETLFLVDKFLFKIIIDDGIQFLDGTLASSVFVKTLLIFAAIFLAIVITRSVLKWYNIHFLSNIDADLIKFFNHIVSLSHGFHTTHKTGSMISRLNRGAGAVESLSDEVILNFAPLIFQLIIVGISLAYFNLASGIVILITTIIFILYSFYIQQSQQEAKLEANHSEDLEKGLISDVFTNIDSIKYFGKEREIGKKYSLASFPFAKNSLLPVRMIGCLPCHNPPTLSSSVNLVSTLYCHIKIL